MLDIHQLEFEIIYALDQGNYKNKFEEAFFTSLDEFRALYGELKLRKICNKISSSQNIIMNIVELSLINECPNPKHLQNIVGNNLYFAFTNKRNVGIAMSIVLYIWHKSVIKRNQSIEEQVLISNLEEIYKLSARML